MLDGVRDKASDLVHGAAYSFVQCPLEGIQQLVEGAGLDLPDIQVINKPDANSGWANAGQFVGNIGLMVALSVGVRGASSKLLGKSASSLSILEAGASGAAFELIQPESAAEKSLGWAKLRDCTVGFATFAAMTGTERGMSRLSLFGRSGSRTFADGALAHGLSGAVGGIVHADGTALFNHGRLASFSDRLSTAGGFAAFGAVLGGTQRLLFKEPVLARQPEPGGGTKLVSSEEYLLRHYENGPAIQSNFLSWIAENRPGLRPKNWQQLKESGKVAEGLDFGVWEPQERVRVLQELRKLARTELSSDRNIDAFLGITGRSHPSLEAWAMAKASERSAHTKWKDAYARLDGIVKTDADLMGKSLLEIIEDESLLNSKPSLKEAYQEALKYEDAHGAAVSNSLMTGIRATGVLEEGLNAAAKALDLPRLKLSTYSPLGEGSYSFGHIRVAGPVLRMGPTAQASEITFHEFLHHRQGTLSLDGLRHLVGAILKRDTQTKLSNALDSHYGLKTVERLLESQPDTNLLLKNIHNDLSARKIVVQHSDDLTAALALGPFTRLSDAALGRLRGELSALVQRLLPEVEEGAYRSRLAYMGTASERQAWAGGTLARIRARVAGIPEPEPAELGQMVTRDPLLLRTLRAETEANLPPPDSLLAQMKNAMKNAARGL